MTDSKDITKVNRIALYENPIDKFRIADDDYILGTVIDKNKNLITVTAGMFTKKFKNCKCIMFDEIKTVEYNMFGKPYTTYKRTLSYKANKGSPRKVDSNYIFVRINKIPFIVAIDLYTYIGDRYANKCKLLGVGPLYDRSKYLYTTEEKYRVVKSLVHVLHKCPLYSTNSNKLSIENLIRLLRANKQDDMYNTKSSLTVTEIADMYNKKHKGKNDSKNKNYIDLTSSINTTNSLNNIEDNNSIESHSTRTFINDVRSIWWLVSNGKDQLFTAHSKSEGIMVVPIELNHLILPKLYTKSQRIKLGLYAG